jgi:hypothetical protein
MTRRNVAREYDSSVNRHQMTPIAWLCDALGCRDVVLIVTRR